MSVVVSVDAVEKTIAAFTRLDQRGDRKAMNKLAVRLQKEQPNLLQYAAALRSHSEPTGEASVFYATLMWAMFDRSIGNGTLPKLTAENLAAAEATVGANWQNLDEKPVYDRICALTAAAQPHIAAKLQELFTEDVKEAAMTDETCAQIVRPTQVVIEAFDAALSGRQPGERQGTIVAMDVPGRNDPCSCGSGKKFKKCHGAV